MQDWYAEPLEEFFGKRKIKSITYGDLVEFRSAREAVKRVAPDPADRTKKIEVDRKTSTVNREMEWLRSIFLYAIRHEWLAKNPFNKGPETLIPKSEEESSSRIPSPEEEARILAVCIDHRAHLRPILIALKDTGLRKGALLSLAWRSVDLGEGLLEIPKGKVNKGRPEIIAMTARLKAELILLWQKSDKKSESKIFGGQKDFKKAYGTACRLAGVEDLHIHDWRHGYATDPMEANVEEQLALKATGHKNIETHMIYRNIDKRLAKVIAESLDALHAEREKTGSPDITDGNDFVS